MLNKQYLLNTYQDVFNTLSYTSYCFLKKGNYLNLYCIIALKINLRWVHVYNIYLY